MKRTTRPASKARPPANRLLLAYYGDDFTGSTDVMEALVRAGLRTALFLAPPTPAQLRRFPGLRAFGVAGRSRSLGPRAMTRELAPIFRRLRQSGAPLIHYKICSTFDSSPRVGSIGHAIELGQRIFHSPFVPLLVGAPVLGRYCVFGNLFARSGLETEPQRLDRHPTMRHHPITPMDESDLRLLLGRQTRRPVHLFDVLRLAESESALPQAWLNGDIILFDVLEQNHLPVIGRLIWSHAGTHPLFVVGSSGVEYALGAYWNELGQLPARRVRSEPKAVEQIVAVSGSCSPVTERQIRHALGAGFAHLPLDVAGLLDGRARIKNLGEIVKEAVRVLDQGQSLILHTCLGPGDRRLAAGTHGRHQEGRVLGQLLGRLLRQIICRRRLPRVAVAGGDTSSDVARALELDGLEAIGPMAPGSPLCKVVSSVPEIDGLEIVFKGGQVGHPDFFSTLLRGGDGTLWDC